MKLIVFFCKYFFLCCGGNVLGWEFKASFVSVSYPKSISAFIFHFVMHWKYIFFCIDKNIFTASITIKM